MKEKLKKVTKYVAVLLLAVSILQVPTAASAHTVVTDISDECFKEAIKQTCWFYYETPDGSVKRVFTCADNETSLIVRLSTSGTQYVISCDTPYKVWSTDGTVKDKAAGQYGTMSIDGFIGYSGENIRLRVDGEIIYDTIPTPTPESTPSETTDGVQFADIFDATIVDVLINILKKMTRLFTIFPLNVVMIASICGIALGLLGKAKKTATKK